MSDKTEEPSDRLRQLLDETNDEDVGHNYRQCFYDWSKRPKLINKSFEEFSKKSNNNYLRGCKWSPDGSCILTNSQDHCLRLFNLPENLCQNQIILEEDIEELVTNLLI